MKKILYTKIDDDYVPMRKVEWEENKPEDTYAYKAMYDDKTGELVWQELTGQLKVTMPNITEALEKLDKLPQMGTNGHWAHNID